MILPSGEYANRHLKVESENIIEKVLEQTLNNNMRKSEFVMRTGYKRFDLEAESVEVKS
jgi:hypothetical protein